MKRLVSSLSIFMFLFVFTLNAEATPVVISSDPGSIGFFIPLQTSTSGAYVDGFGHTSDTITLAPGEHSSGWLDLSLMFAPIPDFEIATADLVISFEDLDLLPYDIAHVSFFETAVLKSGTTEIALLNESYAIGNDIIATNNTTINLGFNLVPTIFSSEAFPDPFSLDLRLRTDLTNNRTTRIRLRNTLESVVSAQLLIEEAVPVPVPEPSSFLLLIGGIWGLFISRKFKTSK